MIINMTNPETYAKQCRVAYRALRFGPLAVALRGLTEHPLTVLLIPGGSIADFEEMLHRDEEEIDSHWVPRDKDSLLVVLPEHCRSVIFTPDALEDNASALSLAFDVDADIARPVGRFLCDMVRFSEEGE